jgi:hypothetical protein
VQHDYQSWGYDEKKSEEKRPNTTTIGFDNKEAAERAVKAFRYAIEAAQPMQDEKPF